MSTLQLIAAVGGSTTVLLAAIATIYKFGPDRTKIIVDSAKSAVEISDSMRDDLREEVAALRAEMAERRREDAIYRTDVESRLAELSAQVRAERAEKVAVKYENERLRERVDELETEVARLKAARP